MRASKLVIVIILALMMLPGSLNITSRSPPAASALGFNWDNAAKVYVLHWDQKSVKSSDPSLGFRIAHENNITLMRSWAGIGEVVQRWRSDRNGTLADFKRMLDDAQANGIRLIISNYLTQGTIEALAGRSYPDWPSAQRDLATPGSAAWSGHMAWLQDLITTFGGHPAAYSWEATNEPGWMLGIDAGAITKDQAAHWLNAFQKAMHSFGARRVNMGGSTFGSMSDPQMSLATQYTDILDDHFYPDYDGNGNPVDGNEQTLLSRFGDHIKRVEALSGRNRSAMVGEYGTLPWTWFTNLSQAIQARGWKGLAWEYDGWDQFWFNGSHRPEVLAHLRSSNPPPPPPLSASFRTTPRAGPGPLTVSFDAWPTGGRPPYSYLWSFGDGSTDPQGSVTHVFREPGTYNVRLRVNDSEGGGAQAVGSVLVVAPLSLSLVVGPLWAVAPAAVYFSAVASGGIPPYRFHWTLGDGTQADLQNISRTYVSPGIYHAEAIVTDSLATYGVVNQSATGGGTFILVVPLKVSVNADRTNGTAPLAVRFAPAISGGSGVYSYRWDFGDGNGSIEQDPIHTYWTPGTFNASLEVRDGLGQTARRTLRITAARNPVPFSSSPPILPVWAAVATACGSGALIAEARRVWGRRRRPKPAGV